MSVRQAVIGFAAGLSVALIGASYIDVPMLLSIEPSDVSAQERWAKDTGSVLMARVGRQFVHGEREDASTFVFHDQPKPMLRYLCRTNRYTIPVGFVRGHYSRPDVLNILDIRMEYGVWALPSEKPTKARNKACAEFNDFGHLIASSDGTTAEMGLVVADAARVAAIAGTPTFRVTCIDHRQNNSPCDGNAALRTLDPRKIIQVINKSTHYLEDKSGIRRTDQLSFGLLSTQDVHPEGMVIEATTFQAYAKHVPDRITIESVAIAFEVY